MSKNLTEEAEKPSEKTNNAPEAGCQTGSQPEYEYLIGVFPQLRVRYTDCFDTPMFISDALFDFCKPLRITNFVKELVTSPCKVGKHVAFIRFRCKKLLIVQHAVSGGKLVFAYDVGILRKVIILRTAMTNSLTGCFVVIIRRIKVFGEQHDVPH